MDSVREIHGCGVPLERADIDTDQIIPAEWLKRTERSGFGAGLFSSWRSDPQFPLNRPEYAGASILLAGKNFGIGSSREHAVWALVDAGFQAVISTRIGDIFKANATRSGLVPAEVGEDDFSSLVQAVLDRPFLELVIDVTELIIHVPAEAVSVPFVLGSGAQARLLSGLDDIDTTLLAHAEIEEFEARRSSLLPRTAP
jgi:3-isopropylmalate/(R)-2-methylmalate dehydratase small subunit